MSNPCCHYWVIETADGPDSKGRCKFCRAERTFANYMPMPSIRDHVMLHRAQRENSNYSGGLTRHFRVRTGTAT